jgi:hypothetical protein
MPIPTTEASRRNASTGLTAIELAIAVAVLAIVITATLSFVRQRRAEQHRQLQINADKTPTSVFEIAFRTDPSPVVAGQRFVGLLDVHNPTSYPLYFNWRFFEYRLHPADGTPPSGPGSAPDRSGFVLTADRRDGADAWRFTSGLDEPPIQAGKTRTYRLDLPGSDELRRDAVTASYRLVIHSHNQESRQVTRPYPRSLAVEGRYVHGSIAIVEAESETE